MIDTAALYDNLLFKGLAPEAVDEITGPLPRLTLAAGETLFDEGDAGSAMYLVVAGIIEIFTTRGAENVTIRTFLSGSYFGELALIGQENRSASARAIEDSTLLAIDREALGRITTTHPIVIGNLGRVLVQQLVTTTRSMVDTERGELVVLVVNGLRRYPEAVLYLLEAASHLSTDETAFIAPHWLFPNADHVASAIRDHVRPTTGSNGATPSEFAYRAGALFEARAGQDAFRLTVDYFRRWWKRTILVLGDDERRWFDLALPHVDRVFVVGTTEEITDWSPKVEPPAQVRIEAVPIVPDGHSRREAFRGLYHAGYERPLIWLPHLNVPGGRFEQAQLTDLTRPDQRWLLRLARGLAKMRVGLALGAGGARGMAHIGAYRYLEERGIPIDAFSGTSIGSMVGGGFANAHTSHTGEAYMLRWTQTSYRKMVRPALSLRSILSGKIIENTCRDLFGSREFIDLPTPLAVSAADLVSGRSVTLKRGRVARAVHASMSIPGMFPPVLIGPYVLVDGGVSNPVPSDALPGLGADVRIVVNISTSPEDVDRWAREEGGPSPQRPIREGQLPSIIDTYLAAFGMAVSERAASSEAEADIYLRPRFLVTSWREFSQGPEHLRRGYEAGERVGDDIRAAIPWSLP